MTLKTFLQKTRLLALSATLAFTQSSCSDAPKKEAVRENAQEVEAYYAAHPEFFHFLTPVKTCLRTSIGRTAHTFQNLPPLMPFAEERCTTSFLHFLQHCVPSGPTQIAPSGQNSTMETALV